MYTEFFRLHNKPFELVPDPDYLYPSKTHKRAIAYLDYGIKERLGFVLLTGEVGSGKTMLIQTMLKSLNRSVSIARIFNTRVTFEQLLAMINDEFGIVSQGKDKVQLLRELYEFLIQRFATGSHAIVIIDEAQNLSTELLEDLRMLSNLETGKTKLLQIILVGQPELRSILTRPELRQLQQRISISCHLYPLTREEVEEYIYHRLDRAGNRTCVAFADEAIQLVYEHSRGIPRLINTMCDFLLLAAFVDQTREITAGMVKDVAQDMDIENRCWGVDQEHPLPEVAVSGNGEEAQDSKKAGAEGGSVQTIMNYINMRFNRLEKAKQAIPEPAPSPVIEQRLEMLEQNVRWQSTQIEPALAELHRAIAALKEERTKPQPAVEQQRAALPEVKKESFMKRLFG
ncbi:MAG TPA: XrtA/PEP-CTERM system-associated ATPase [Dissulfurispiraceae bacterium]|nr:XrtA/PEP-CTERM system-associated ATPase [Dissulfurispiraceae bacterium]